VDFRNTIIILTSNLGVNASNKGAGLGFGGEGDSMDYERLKAKMLDDAKRSFKPEFLNRLDDMVVFRTLTKDDMVPILDIELKKVIDRLASKGHKLKLHKSAMDYLVEKGYDPAFGARPLRRAVSKYLEDALSEEILKGTLTPGLMIDVKGSAKGLIFKQRSPRKRSASKTAKKA